MVTSISQSVTNKSIGFSVFDELTYSDNSLPFGNVLSAKHIRELFVDSNNLFGYGEDDLWNTGLTLWAFVGQVLQDGKQCSCSAAVTNATRYMIEHGMTPPGPDSGEYCRARLTYLGNWFATLPMKCHWRFPINGSGIKRMSS